MSLAQGVTESNRAGLCSLLSLYKQNKYTPPQTDPQAGSNSSRLWICLIHFNPLHLSSFHASMWPQCERLTDNEPQQRLLLQRCSGLRSHPVALRMVH